MKFDLEPDEKLIIDEVKQFLKNEVSEELIDESKNFGFIYGGPIARRFIRKFASKGWLTSQWPEEYGGMNSSAALSFAIREQMALAGTPTMFIGANMAGPTMMHFASDQMKNKYLPRISKGEIEFALGYTEPQAGSDLSAIEMRAEDKGDHFVVNGSKTFNTSTHCADYHWLAAITDPNAPRKHKGVSIMIVDLKTPGITVRPLITMVGWRTNEVFYDNVIVPKENLVGELNRGFYYLMAALDFERVFALGIYQTMFEDLVDYAKSKFVAGKALSKNPLIRQKLAQCAIEFEVNRLLYYRLSYMLDNDQIPNYQSSMQKLFGTEVSQRVSNTAMEILGHFGQLSDDGEYSALKGAADYFYRNSVVETIYGGSSEIQRNIMAQRGLKLPVS